MQHTRVRRVAATLGRGHPHTPSEPCQGSLHGAMITAPSENYQNRMVQGITNRHSISAGRSLTLRCRGVERSCPSIRLQQRRACWFGLTDLEVCHHGGGTDDCTIDATDGRRGRFALTPTLSRSHPGFVDRMSFRGRGGTRGCAARAGIWTDRPGGLSPRRAIIQPGGFGDPTFRCEWDVCE
jgi:hypothetical protein